MKNAVAERTMAALFDGLTRIERMALLSRLEMEGGVDLSGAGGR